MDKNSGLITPPQENASFRYLSNYIDAHLFVNYISKIIEMINGGDAERALLVALALNGKSAGRGGAEEQRLKSVAYIDASATIEFTFD
ncbi:hypothetical protein [uncultured Ferrimonas sp.]|uniref:hypothetical protein n=1 Tax=uncultured Ferrimonas sp. TaxID=432640 RepID=UPI0026189100|nr:hypothetical protein [uncultured Ferrimonas sp.]